MIATGFEKYFSTDPHDAIILSHKINGLDGCSMEQGMVVFGPHLRTKPCLPALTLNLIAVLAASDSFHLYLIFVICTKGSLLNRIF